MDIDNYPIFGEIEFICEHDWEWDQLDCDSGVWVCLWCWKENHEKEEPGDYYYGDEVI